VLLREDVVGTGPGERATLRLTYERVQGMQEGRPVPPNALRDMLLEVTVGSDGRITRISGVPAFTATGLLAGFDAAHIFQAALPVFPRQRPPLQGKWGSRASVELVGLQPAAVLRNHTFEHYEEGSQEQVIHVISNVTVPLEHRMAIEGRQVALQGQQYLQTHTSVHLRQGRMLASQGRGFVRLADPAGQVWRGALMEYSLALQE
jgi:hypothetical protein